MNEFSGLLNELESIRKTVFPKLAVCIGLIVGGLVINIFSMMSMVQFRGGFGITIGIFVMLTGLILLLVWAEPARKDFAAAYKNNIITRVMSQKLDNVMYDPKLGFAKEYIRATGFMMLGNRYKSEDLITGSYKSVGFRRADVVIQDHRSNGKSSYTVTYFKGRWMVFNFNKNFSNDLQIIQRGFGYTNKKKSIFTAKEQRRHRIEFENVAFNNQFECFCQDEQEAFYLITPQIQEALMNFNRVIDGRLMVGFKGNVVNVAIENGKDMLEPSVSRPVSYENDILPILQERNIIQNFVDILKIDRNIYKQ